MKKVLVGLIVILAVGVLFISILSISGSDDGSENPGESTTKTFILTGENYKFMSDGEINPDLVVNRGDLVRIEFSSTQGFHDWVLDEFNAATEKVRNTDGSTYVEFVADETGTFEYYCSVGQHRENGMRGNLIVR